MSQAEAIFLTLFALINLMLFLQSIDEIRFNKNSYKTTQMLSILGAFVWGDVLIIAPFWFIVSFVSIIANNMYLFLLSFSLFWVIRSFGEMIYWISEQFAVTKRNQPEKLLFHGFLKNTSVWFIYQVFAQCIFVCAVILSIYFSAKWLHSIL